MKALPIDVREKFEALKKEYTFPIQMHVINGHFYIYKQISKAEYIGRIDENGLFFKKEKTKAEPSQSPPNEDVISILDDKDLSILKVLSMNAIMPLKYMGKLLNIPPTTLESRIKNLENSLCIKYITEIDLDKLGYTKYLISVKFKDHIPALETIKRVMDREPRVQLAVLMKGSCDLLIYALGRNNDSTEAIDIITSLRHAEGLSGLKAEWNSQPFYEHFGMVPLRAEFFDLLEKRVFRRVRDKDTHKWLKKTQEQLSYREFILLKEFGLNGAVSFSDIERKHDMPKGSVGYIFDRLRTIGLIKRITINLTGLPVKYIGVLYKSVVEDNRFVMNRKKFLQWMIEYTRYPINKFTLAGDTIAPDGSILFMPVFDDFSMDKETGKIADRTFGMQTKVDVGTAVITGTFCYRLFDVIHSKQQEKLQEKFGISQPQTLDYEILKKGIVEL